jgi:hypothetical protein
VHPKRHPGVARDDRVVHLDAFVEQLVRIAATPTVAFAQLVIEEGSILRRVDLDTYRSRPAHR